MGRFKTPVVVLAGHSVSLGEIASGATQREVRHRCLAALRSRNHMLDMKRHAGRKLQQPAILASPTSAGDYQRSEGRRRRHPLSLRMGRTHPNRHSNGVGWFLHSNALRKCGQLLGVGDHQLLSLSDEAFEDRLLFRRDRSFAVLVQQRVHPTLLGRRKSSCLRRNRLLLHGSKPVETRRG